MFNNENECVRNEKNINEWGAIEVKKEIVGYCVRDISRFALGRGNKEESKLRNNLQA